MVRDWITAAACRRRRARCRWGLWAVRVVGCEDGGCSQRWAQQQVTSVARVHVERRARAVKRCDCRRSGRIAPPFAYLASNWVTAAQGKSGRRRGETRAAAVRAGMRAQDDGANQPTGSPDPPSAPTHTQRSPVGTLTSLRADFVEDAIAARAAADLVARRQRVERAARAADVLHADARGGAGDGGTGARAGRTTGGAHCRAGGVAAAAEESTRGGFGGRRGRAESARSLRAPRGLETDTAQLLILFKSVASECAGASPGAPVPAEPRIFAALTAVHWAETSSCPALTRHSIRDHETTSFMRTTATST
jgi:hypothetical protein